MNNLLDTVCEPLSESERERPGHREIDTGNEAAVEKPILVVDDDPNLLHIVRRVLEYGGHRVLVANHGQEALKVLETERPRLVLLDMRMPIMDGPSFMKAVSNWSHRPPVVLFSAAEDAQAMAAHLNADGFLEKPFDLGQLLEVVEKYK